MVKIKNKNACILSFSSFSELLESAEKSTPVKYGDAWQFGSNSECDSREKTYSLLKAGRGLSTVRRLSKKYRNEFENSDFCEIMNRVKSVKRRRVFNDFAGSLDIDRVINGDTDFWEKIERSGKAQVVRIGINYALSLGNSEKHFSRMVALSAIFAEILENLGYGVEIYGAGLYHKHRGAKGKDFRGILIPVKSVTEPLDFDRIYSLGLQGMLRDAHFRAEDTFFGFHGGRCLDIPQDVITLANVDVLIYKSWIDGNQVEKIVQAIKSL